MACLDLRRVTVFTMLKILLTSRPPHPTPPQSRSFTTSGNTKASFPEPKQFLLVTAFFVLLPTYSGVRQVQEAESSPELPRKETADLLRLERSNVGLASSTPQETVPLQGCRGTQSGPMLALEFPFERTSVRACGPCDLGRTLRGLCHLCHTRARTGRNSNVPVTYITGRD